MKKNILFAIVLSVTALSANAQVKVAANGKTYIQHPTEDGHSILSVGESQYLDYDWHYGNEIGAFIHKKSDTANYCIGTFSESKGGQIHSIGVWGHGWGAPYSGNFGVLGTVRPDESGAGVCGTEEGDAPPAFYGTYGGYFYGDTYTEGEVIATMGFYNYSDIRLKDNVQPISFREVGSGSTLDNLQRLDVLEFNLKSPSQVNCKDQLEGKTMSSKDRERTEKRHFGIAAQELQKVYPELVEEGQEGFLMVNYVELVPILLRSIQELKSELDELKGKDSHNGVGAGFVRDDGSVETDPAPARSQETAIGGTSSKTKAVLYQNTPNPFTVQTEIRFSLPENAKNAYIYIFDMQGKMQKQIAVDPSMQSVTINGYELQAGIYLYSLVVGGQEIDTKRMFLSK
jgi:hypothetical protein